jgi:nucleoside-diphosphate-sugar epimerase
MIGKRIIRRLSHSCSIISVGRAADAEIAVDLSSPASGLLPPKAADVMIHCAASFAGNRIEELIENELVNAVGCLRIAQIAAAIGCRHLIFLSSVSACQENARGSSYGLSKKHGQENLELACRELKIDLTSLQITQVYDDLGEARRHQPMFYRIIDCARDSRDFAVFGQNDPLRNLLFVEDLVSIIERVMNHRLAGSYNVVHPVSYSISAIAKMVFEVFGANSRVVLCPEKPAIPAVLYPSDTTLYRLIEYEPETDLRTGITLIRDRLPR